MQKMAQPAQFVFPVEVWIEDTDYGGVVYHANYLKYFERARSAWIEMLGWGLDFQRQHALMFAVRSARIDYLKPAMPSQKLEVVTSIASVGRASINFRQLLRDQADAARRLCVAEIRIASVRPGMKLCSLPVSLREECQKLAS